jgi:hypothetical protein
MPSGTLITMNRPAILLAFFCLAIALSGCGRGVNPESSGTKAASGGLVPGTWSGLKDGAEITLSISKDGRFQTVFRGGDFRSVVKGRAKIVDEQVVLEATEFDGRPPASHSEKLPIKFQVSDQWSNLVSEDGVRLGRKI